MIFYARCWITCMDISALHNHLRACHSQLATTLSFVHHLIIFCLSLQPTIGYLEEPDIDAFQ